MIYCDKIYQERVSRNASIRNIELKILYLGPFNNSTYINTIIEILDINRKKLGIQLNFIIETMKETDLYIETYYIKFNDPIRKNTENKKMGKMIEPYEWLNILINKTDLDLTLIYSNIGLIKLYKIKNKEISISPTSANMQTTPLTSNNKTINNKKDNIKINKKQLTEDIRNKLLMKKTDKNKLEKNKINKN